MKMRDYIYEQPYVLARILQKRKDNLSQFVSYYQQVNPDHLYLIACGSSYNAARTTVDFLAHMLDIEVSLDYPSALPFVRSERPLILVISQGGESTNTIAAIKRLESYPLVAVTGEIECTLNTLCGNRVYLECGPETAGPKTKGYTATILTLCLLALETGLAAGTISGKTYAYFLGVLEEAAANMKENIERTATWLAKNLDSLVRVEKFVMTGKGTSGIVAAECALKMMETLLIPAMGLDFEEFLHGPVCTLDTHMGGIYLLADDRDKKRMLAVASLHQSLSPYVYLVTADTALQGDHILHLLATGEEITRGFETILPAQFIASETPAARGIEGKGMRFFAKVDEAVGIKVDNSSNQ